ncbi:MAG: 50S ribosomal protein L29 [Bdellovibrionales bacterium]|nr:50S ribosomal protein L29 [Bdellovibrionales bacterium]
MKFSEIANLEEMELRKKKIILRAELFQSRMKLKMQRLSNPLHLRFLKRDIARIETALSSKRKGGQVK